MTMITVSTKALAALDRIRSQRGIRTRAKALEIIAFEAAPEHPLEQKMRDAKTVKPTALESERATSYLARKKAATVETFSPAEALLEAAKLRGSK
jgi:hypothetical protein